MRSPWGRRAAGLALAAAALVPAARAGGEEPPLAWLEGARVLVRSAEGALPWPGLEDVDTFAWDREGRALLVTRRGLLQRIAADGRRATLAHGYADVRFPDACPANGRIAFACTLPGAARDDWQLRVVEADGRGNLELGPGYDPAFLPDGSALVFEAFEETGPDLWIHSFAGGTRRRLFEQRLAGGRYTPAVAPDGKSVAFSSGGRLMLAALDGSQVRDLSPEGATYDRFASFAPDGGTLAFFREREERVTLVLKGLDGAERELESGPRATLPAFRPARHAPIVTALDPPGAAALVASAGGAAIDLPDLAVLDADTARALARTAGPLALDGLTTIDATTAGALAEWSGNGEAFILSLDGWRDPGPAALAVLARCRGWGLSLGGLRELSPESLHALASFSGALLRLRSLPALDEAVAREVARTWQVKWLELDFEASVSEAARRALAEGSVALR